MSTASELSPGYVVEELEIGVDTEDIELATDPWERLADVYAAGEHCPGCMWHESGRNPYTGQRWRECGCFDPAACPAINPRSIANALRRQAS